MADFLFLKQRVTVWFAALYRHRVVSDVKDTKFESNSQHCREGCRTAQRCFGCQRYKI